MQFYARFQDEVIAEPSTVAAHVERARREVTPAFRKLFDEALVDAHEHLVANPSDVRSKARFVTIYHLILESTLRELLPAVAEALGGADGSAPDLDRLGVDADEVRAFALDGLTRRLDIIGVPLASLA